ncbi:MAG: hypothetical protein ACR2OU_19615 [Thermomicrobiales bacterium]
MASSSTKDDELRPDKAIRRFDVFAEYTRLERLDKDYPEDEAKGYGIWLAKVVASRKFSSKSAESKSSGKKRPGPEPKFREIGDELQTDETFDHDIVDRMGTRFYSKVFAPAIAEAKAHGKSYEDIRDPIRKDWKPASAAARKKSQV